MAAHRRKVDLVELEWLYRSRYARFRRVAFALLRDHEDGGEAVQEAFTRAVRANASFRGESELEASVWHTFRTVSWVRGSGRIVIVMRALRSRFMALPSVVEA